MTEQTPGWDVFFLFFLGGASQGANCCACTNTHPCCCEVELLQFGTFDLQSLVPAKRLLIFTWYYKFHPYKQ